MNSQIISGGARVSVYTDHFNKRLRIDDYAGPIGEVLAIIRGQVSDWVEKLIIKSRREDVAFFLSEGFTEEAYIKNYFSGADLYFLTQYFSPERKVSKNWKEEEIIIEKVLASNNQIQTEEESVRIEFATERDSEDLSKLYSNVFKVYPTPVSDASFIRKTINEGTVYAYIRRNGKIISAASAEINAEHRNAEMTDCASLKEAEGNGYMKKLISALEKKLLNEGITCLYSIARAESFSMNMVFHQLGYTYSGRMINNCYVYSGIEDMNVWYKIIVR